MRSLVRVFKALGPIDWRNIRHDPMLCGLVLLPLLIGVLLRWLVPAMRLHLLEIYGFELQPYYALIMSLPLELMPILTGIIIGFLILDQRDDHTLTALQVTPMSLAAYFAYRLALPMGLSFFTTVLIFPVANIMQPGLWPLCALSLGAAPLAPFYALFLGGVAANKVQGFALMKANGIMMAPPMLACFIHSDWQILFGLVPTYWPAKAFLGTAGAPIGRLGVSRHRHRLPDCPHRFPAAPVRAGDAPRGMSPERQTTCEMRRETLYLPNAIDRTKSMPSRKLFRSLLPVVLLFAAQIAQVSCGAADEKGQRRELAHKIAEDKMNPMSEYVARQLEKGLEPNRLIREKSPYLLQHSFNPVDWYPWGEEAFAKARAENKPIFLSVGYSTCHWCHVMEHESFENPEIAAIMNQHFINIKVDREERPDVDRVYMSAVQALTGSGGWPMSVFLTPDLRPFYGGTYFPPKGAFGRPGFADLLNGIHEAWQAKHEQILKSADEITAALQRQLASPADSGAVLGVEGLETEFAAFQKAYDAEHGGFSEAPKFPRPSTLNFLFHYYKRTGNRHARDMALSTLEKMAAGGMYDHLGGGFHRYSVDKLWRVPHFEKMLYDQAQLANSYLDAYQLTGDEKYARVARETLGYVLRDMTAPGGAFYSAEDADSAPDAAHPDHKVEGAFYMWTAAELRESLGDPDAAVFTAAYGVSPNGNTLADPHGEFGDRNVLYAAQSPADLAKRFGKPLKEIEAALQRGREKLLAVRSTRPRPALDDKIITAWNGLMISAFARAGALLQDSTYTAAAARAADFLLQNLLDTKDQRLSRRYRDGEARFPGHLDDYAFFANGLIDLYEATAGITYLREARALVATMVSEFRDTEDNTFYDASNESKELLFRSKEFYDGAEPAGNSMAILALLRLGRMLDEREFLEVAESALRACSPLLGRAPSAFPQLATALDFALDKPMQIVIAGTPAQADARPLLDEINRRYLPNRVLLFADAAEGQKWLARKLPFLTTMAKLQGKAAAYVCENFTCELPTADPRVLAGLLQSAGALD